MNISEVISKRRNKLGLTLAEVAAQMGVSEATVQRWEHGTIKNLRHDRIGRLAEVLMVSPAVLMGWEELPDKDSDLLTLGQYIRRYRIKNGLSVDQFSEASGISSERIIHLEKGVDESTGKIVVPAIKDYMKVAQATKKSLADILAHVSNDFMESNGSSSTPHNYTLMKLRRKALEESGIPADSLKKIGRILDVAGIDYELVGVNLEIHKGDRKSRQITPEEYLSLISEIERYINFVIESLAWDNQ